MSAQRNPARSRGPPPRVPELVDAVEPGKIAVSAAADIASVAARGTARNRAEAESAEILPNSKSNPRASESATTTHRVGTDQTIRSSNHTALLPIDRKYPIVLADPPWNFEVYDEESGIAAPGGNALPDACRWTRSAR